MGEFTLGRAGVLCDPVGSKKIRGSNFLDGEERVCGAICQEWYTPFWGRKIFCLEVF